MVPRSTPHQTYSARDVACPDHQDQLEHPESQESPDDREHPEPPDGPASRQLLHVSPPPHPHASHAHKAHPDLPDHLEPPEIQERLEPPDAQEPMPLPDHLDHVDLLDHLESLDSLDLPESPEYLPPASHSHLEHLESQEMLVSCPSRRILGL